MSKVHYVVGQQVSRSRAKAQQIEIKIPEIFPAPLVRSGMWAYNYNLTVTLFEILNRSKNLIQSVAYLFDNCRAIPNWQ